MRRTRRESALLSRRLRGSGGFTIIEVLVMVGVSICVVMAAAVAYEGTIRSWRGTAALLDIQRDASLGVELMQRSLRGSCRVDPDDDGDSLEFYYRTAAGAETLAGRFYLDANGYVRDINGAALASRVEDLSFSMTGNALNIDLTLKDDVGTAERSTDDQAVFFSSSIVPRN
jgi:type II secretory pathway component PulJ